MSDLTEYQRGYLDGMWAYAWWKDGQAFVGTTGTTYRRAVEKFLDDGSTVVFDDRDASAGRSSGEAAQATKGTPNA